MYEIVRSLYCYGANQKRTIQHILLHSTYHTPFGQSVTF